MKLSLEFLTVCILIPLHVSEAQVDPTAPEYECPYCSGIFPNQEMLNSHIQSTHTFVCPYCSEVYRSESALENHINMEHTYDCPYCDSLIVGEDAYNEHIAAYHTFVCLICGDTLIGQVNYDLHIADNHTFECPYCNAVFTTEQALSDHESSNHVCPYCYSSEIYSDSVALDRHIQDKHTYECPYCDESIVGFNEFQEHVSYNHKCPYCFHTFPNRDELESHIQADHYYPCPRCDFRAYTQEELSEHIYAQHRNIRTLNERYLNRSGSVSLGMRYMQFYNPIEPDEPHGKILFDSQFEYEPVALGFAFNIEKPPDESTMPDTTVVLFATSSVRLGALISINRYLNIGAGVGYSTTYIFETEEYAEGTDGHFGQYLAVDLCIGLGEEPTRVEENTNSTSTHERVTPRTRRESSPRESTTRSETSSNRYFLTQLYIRPSIEHTEQGWFTAVSIGIMGAWYSLHGN